MPVQGVIDGILTQVLGVARACPVDRPPELFHRHLLGPALAALVEQARHVHAVGEAREGDALIAVLIGGRLHVDVAGGKLQHQLAALLVERDRPRLREYHERPLRVRPVRDHDLIQTSVVVPFLDVEEAILAETAELARLDQAAPGEHGLDRGAHLASRGRLGFESESQREPREQQAQQEHRNHERAQPETAGSHRGDLHISCHAPDRQQHPEQEGDRKRVDHQHGAEQRHDHEQVGDFEARVYQVFERANQVSRHQHDDDRRETQQCVDHHFAQQVGGDGSRCAHIGKYAIHPAPSTHPRVAIAPAACRKPRAARPGADRVPSVPTSFRGSSWPGSTAVASSG